MSLFPTNIGKVERIVRALLGVGILSLTVVGPRSPWAYLGLLPLLTALLGWCPLYSLLGLSPARKKAT